MRFWVLGSVLIHDSNRQPILIRSLLQRRLLAVLLCRANEPVTPHDLSEAVWVSGPPKQAADGLRVHIHRLRRHLGASRIDHGPAGYRLNVDPGELDAHEFVDLVTRARVLVAEKGVPRARDLLRSGLGLWRAPAYCGIDDHEPVRGEAMSLNELRQTAYEECFELELSLGMHTQICGELRARVAAEPYRERLRTQLMLALHRSDRQADALAVFDDTRRLLADELGIDPSPQLRELHEGMLRNEPVLRVSGTDGTVTLPPRQLPSSTAAFTGRTEQIRQLDALAERGGSQSGVVIAAITGMAGVGKTSLALHWAHRVRDRFPDGQLYVNLRGFDPTGSAMGLAEAVRGFLDAFEVPPNRIPAGVPAQVGLYRSLLAGRRVLVVLDNASDAEQVRPLLPGTPGCLVLVTSRDLLDGLVAVEGAQPVGLDVMSTPEAQEMLARRLGPQRVVAESDALGEIISCCAGLPLALAVVAGRAATHPEFPLSALARELRGARGKLDAFDRRDPSSDIRRVFSWSYRALSRGAARLFRALGEHPGPDTAEPAAASLAGLTVDQVRPLLAELARAHLAVEHRVGRYVLHDLLRAFAAGLGGDLGERRDAWHRVLGHYVHTAHAADLLLDADRLPPTLPAAPAGVTPERFADQAPALAWFTAEHAVLLTAVERAAAEGLSGHAWRLAWALTFVLDRRRQWRDLAAVHRTALRAAEGAADLPGQARALCGLARADAREGRPDDAMKHLQRALVLCAELDDARVTAHVHLDIAAVGNWQGLTGEALRHAQHALEVLRSDDPGGVRARALNTIGWFQAQLGNLQEAMAHCQLALALYEGTGNRYGEANTTDSLGYICHRLGHYAEAARYYRRATDLYEALGDHHQLATTLSQLGETYTELGEPHAARESLQRAVEILDRLGDPSAEGIRAALLDIGATPVEA